ncbi:nitrous oxidase accessory protein NosD [Symbiobacterium terraclitae]|uniref:Nitrous oxidase accessory protein NosD n=1 Tax=Symbiobacterium terraclitae TaxID=557451 RepID=A0ABS4JPG2_9FIRM|nr:right-handed parallel beta-helix repeat-containing protein [Symbiobacterium terraclitae]MBP2017428.1 nitrous oxidase accessory protein NosD [Symbiobacterium terraclitae]
MAVIRVPADYRTIQEAVNAARPGDTVRVAGGVYAEAVTIREGRDRLAIIGPGAGDAILQGNGIGPGFLIGGSGTVTIAGFTVTGFEFGIEVSSNDNVIRDVVLTGNARQGAGVAETSFRSLFYRVTASQNGGDGIEINGGGNYVIRSELRENGDDGLDLNGPTNVALHNLISGNRDRGIEVQGDTALIAGNRVVGNRIGIASTAGQHLIYDNFVSRNQTVGILLQDSDNSLILANEVTCNQEEGLFFNGGTGFRVIRNKVESNGHDGIELSAGASEAVVDDNEVKENGLAGIRPGSATARNVVRRNKLKRNSPDIEDLAPAGANVFDENDCKTSRPTGPCC